MEDGCNRTATWRSDDGYPFCDNHAYGIYLAECELEQAKPMLKSQWDRAGKPHGPNTQVIGCVWCKGRTLPDHDCRNFAHLEPENVEEPNA